MHSVARGISSVCLVVPRVRLVHSHAPFLPSANLFPMAFGVTSLSCWRFVSTCLVFVSRHCCVLEPHSLSSPRGERKGDGRSRFASGFMASQATLLFSDSCVVRAGIIVLMSKFLVSFRAACSVTSWAFAASNCAVTLSGFVFVSDRSSLVPVSDHISLFLVSDSSSLVLVSDHMIACPCDRPHLVPVAAPTLLVPVSDHICAART